MKMLIAIILSAAALIGVLKTPSKANERERRQKSEVAIVHWGMAYGKPVPFPDGNGWYSPELGLVTTVATCSTGAPTVKAGSNLADVMAALIDEGYSMTPEGYGRITFIKR